MSQGKILVIRGGAIGDFILTLPVMAALRRQFPDLRLEVLGYPHIAALAEAGGWVDAMRSIDSRPLAGFFARGGDLNFELASYFAEFHVIFSYLYDPDEIFRTNLARISKAQVIQGPHRPQEDRDMHAAEQLLEPLQRLAIFDAESQPRLKFAPPSPALSTPTLALHPGSGSERKNWPESNWREFIRRLLTETPLSLVLVGGEAEGARLERLASGHHSPERIRLRRGLPLPQLGAFLSGCTGFVGHDSGISHLAAAVGIPGLVIWGPTNARVWRPHSDRFVVLPAGPELADLTVESLLTSLLSRLPTWQL
jgi:heptosyltransferase-2